MEERDTRTLFLYFKQNILMVVKSYKLFSEKQSIANLLTDFLFYRE